MKRILLLIFLFAGLFARAQQNTNAWIDFSKTYYKFYVGSNGLYRISQATLNSTGLANTPAENFQLWRNGQEIPIYTSIPTGQFSGTDYIEFWGEMNNGKFDKSLYSDPDYQLNDHWSLQTDSATYFLTVNSSSANRRLINAANNLAGNTLAPEPYFIYTLGNYFRNRINLGNAAMVQTSYVYSSAYDKGEGYTSGDIGNGGSLSFSHTNLHVYNSGPAPTFSINAAGNAVNTRAFRMSVNSTQLVQQSLDYYTYTKYQGSFPLSLINTSSANVTINNDCTASGDRMVVAQYEINYPRQFDFDNARSFFFNLPANVNGNYLEIRNFNYGSTAPVLYDITNGQRYVADISDPSVIKIVLGGSNIDRQLVLVSEDPSGIAAIGSFQTRNFINYGLPANQGDYLIITNSSLLNGSNGSTPVDDYKNYRTSASGGSYNAKIYDVDQLVDQFAYGIKKHPLSIRNFIDYALNNYTAPPKFVFLVGKGVNYIDNRTYESNPDPTIKNNLNKLNLVPTFGYPASDNLFTCFQGSDIPKVPIGRLSVISADEMAPYLKKVKEYEAAQSASSPYIADRAWIKNVVHVAGADDPSLQTILAQLLSNYKTIISDTLFGGNVNTFTKSTADVAVQIKSDQLKNLFAEGISCLLYFGHSAAATLDFNLDDPLGYNNPGKYPVFIALGCNAGNLYNFNQNRLLTKETVSEKFVLTPDRGSVAFLASTSLGIVQYLDILNYNNYKAISYSMYGKTIGEVMTEAIRRSFDVTTQFDFYARTHMEQMSLNGDPALKFNAPAKPDYVIEDQLVKISPSFIAVSETSFKVDAKMMNMGKAVDKKIVVEIKRTYPNNSTVVIRRDTIPGIRYMDSLSIDVPIVANRDKGLNKITITLDADNSVDESYENNNSITKDVFIYDDAARPVYPYNYSIINHQDIKFAASTANPFAAAGQYYFELDTTELFNSALKFTKTITTVGGVIELTPTVSYRDSTVYYWRIAPVPASGAPTWSSASFIYLAGSEPGFNQSHFYQHLKSFDEGISLDSASRTWNFGTRFEDLFVRHGSWVTSSNQEINFIVSSETLTDNHNTCYFQSVVYNVFDPNTFKPWVNVTQDNIGLVGHGLYGSTANNCSPGRKSNFEYRWDSATSRKRAMDFMKNVIPDGAFVVVRSCLLDPVQFPTFANLIKYAPDWHADETIYGAGQSLDQYLKNAGFTGIDSFNRPRQFIFIYKKNDPSFTPKWVFSEGTYDNFTLTAACQVPDSAGYITSPVFGPAKQWKELHWKGASVDTAGGDMPTIDVYGIDKDGNETMLYSQLNTDYQDIDISDISADMFPYVKLKMTNVDTVHYTPYQLSYWRVNYVPVPEGAIAPNISFEMRDTVDVGEPINFKIAFKNVSESSFDSLKVKLSITDRKNVQNIIPIPRQKALSPDSILTVSTTIDTRSLAGSDNLHVEVNPDFDQPEQYLFNNFAYKGFYVRPDSLNPLMDVTFDGMHILNRDIVSSKPHILVKLKDEAKWMSLSDTSLLTLKLRFPDGSLHPYYFTSDTLRFTGASPAPTTNNSASIDFLPNLSVDGDYELIVTGKDMSDNQAGNIEYRVSFQVINKSMISNMLNYPNPFTTSTAFVFTLTGSEIPQNIKIEIMTITGRIVREITKDELGPLHIGRNITEFKWDGTDQFGQKLANGIYLYRVVTNLNGQSLEKYRSKDDDTDKYFNKGYGKMYLMR